MVHTIPGMISSFSSDPCVAEDRLLRIKKELHQKLITEMDIAAMGTLGQDELREEVRRGAEQLCRQSNDLLSLAKRNAWLARYSMRRLASARSNR